MSNTVETPVVIIGGSIVGLSTSAFLAQRKVPHIMIERHIGSSPHPRAIGYTTRTIEYLRTLGIDDQIPVVSHGFRPRRVQVESLAGKWEDESFWTADGKSQANTPGKPQGRPGGGKPETANTVSPVGNAAISQDKIEPIIRKKALDLGADHRQGWKMTSWSQNEDGVSVTAVSKAGEELSIRAKYLIAADGPRSQIREALHIGRSGLGVMRSIRSVLFKCESIKKYLDRGYHQFNIKNGDFEAFMVTYPDGRWALMRYNEDRENLSDAELKDIVRKAVGEDLPDDEIELLANGAWDLAALISDSFQSGRIFFAGDSAHTLPPTRGGYGANTGIADGYNLAWKLEAVLSGRSSASLLDTYDEERRPVASIRHDQIFARADYKDYLKTSKWQLPAGTEIIDDNAMELGQLYRSSSIIGSEDLSLPAAKAPDQWAGQPGTRAAHFWITRNNKRESILDTFHQGWVILSEDSKWRDTGRQAAKACNVSGDFVQIGSEATEEEQGSFRRLYGVNSTGAILVRPDGYIAWRCVDAPENAAEVLTKVLAQVAHVTKKN